MKGGVPASAGSVASVLGRDASLPMDGRVPASAGSVASVLERDASLPMDGGVPATADSAACGLVRGAWLPTGVPWFVADVVGDDGENNIWRNSSDVSEGERLPCTGCVLVGEGVVTYTGCVAPEPGDAWVSLFASLTKGAVGVPANTGCVASELEREV